MGEHARERAWERCAPALQEAEEEEGRGRGEGAVVAGLAVGTGGAGAGARAARSAVTHLPIFLCPDQSLAQAGCRAGATRRQLGAALARTHMHASLSLPHLPIFL